MHNCIGRNFLEFVRLIVQSVRDFALQKVRLSKFKFSTFIEHISESLL
jgi:hypothetical protein